MPWAQWVGFTSSIESVPCGRQVVETSGFDQLQSIYKRHCHLGRCPGTNFLKNAPKSTRLNCRFALLVVMTSTILIERHRRIENVALNPFILLDRGSEEIKRSTAQIAGALHLLGRAQDGANSPASGARCMPPTSIGARVAAEKWSSISVRISLNGAASQNQLPWITLPQIPIVTKMPFPEGLSRPRTEFILCWFPSSRV